MPWDAVDRWLEEDSERIVHRAIPTTGSTSTTSRHVIVRVIGERNRLVRTS